MLKTMFWGIALMSLLATGVIGCAAKSGTFEVLVRNHTTSPMSVGLVKDGPPFESTWASPEDLVTARPDLTEHKWGRLVEPGGQLTIGPVDGKFDQQTMPYLRVYRGDLTVDELLAINRNSPDRMAIGLRPGKLSVDIVDRDGRITAVAPEEVIPPKK